MTYRKAKLLVLAFTVLGANLLMGGQASAFTIDKTSYEDIGDAKYFNDNTVLIVGQTRFVREASVTVKAYFNDRSGNELYLDNYHYCPSISGWDLAQPDDQLNLKKTSGTTGQNGFIKTRIILDNIT